MGNLPKTIEIDRPSIAQMFSVSPPRGIRTHPAVGAVIFSQVHSVSRSERLHLWPKNFPSLSIADDGNQFSRSCQLWHVCRYPLQLSIAGLPAASSAEGYIQRIPACDMSEQLPRDNNNQLGIVWTANEIAEAVGGHVIKWGPSGSISTDTRTLQPGQWFLALTGPRFDGHDFLHSALAKGCAGVVGNGVYDGWPVGFVQVDGSTLISLQRLGASARKKFRGPVVGITGSAGKTTTRAMVALALEPLGHIHQTSGNQNNHIGVPLSLLAMPLFSKACVLEMGMNHLGEIQELSRISEPSVRVVLNVGPAHTENFRSLEEVAMAKGEIVLEARPGDVCVLNADDPLVMNLPIPNGVQRVLFGSKVGCDVRLIAAQSTQGGCAVQVTLEHCSSANSLLGIESKEKSTRESVGLEGDTNSKSSSSRVVFEIPSPGLHLAMNACAAGAVAVSLGIPLPQVGKLLANFRPAKMRLNIENCKNKIRIINDAYNANPLSMVAALELLHSIDCKGRRVAVLGDMLELGKFGERAHLDVIKLCIELDFDLVGVAGLQFMEAIKVADLTSAEFSMISALDSESLALQIGNKLTVGDAVLVKGSRGMKMEVIVDVIRSIQV